MARTLSDCQCALTAHCWSHKFYTESCRLTSNERRLWLEPLSFVQHCYARPILSLGQASQHGRTESRRWWANTSPVKVPCFRYHFTQDEQLFEEVSGSSTQTHDILVSAPLNTCSLLYERAQDEISATWQRSGSGFQAGHHDVETITDVDCRGHDRQNP